MADDLGNQSDLDETRRFAASRLTRENLLFPTVIAVTPIQVVKTKRSWVSSDEESINIRHIASVRIKTGVLFSDIWIESSGGANQIFSHGHWKGDAREIKRLIEEHQRTRGVEDPVILRTSADTGSGSASGARGGGSQPNAATKTCPWCAETIKADARFCRFCRRDIP